MGDIADELMEKIKTRAEKLNVKDDKMSGAAIGPIVTAQAKALLRSVLAAIGES